MHEQTKQQVQQSSPFASAEFGAKGDDNRHYDPDQDEIQDGTTQVLLVVSTVTSTMSSTE